MKKAFTILIILAYLTIPIRVCQAQDKTLVLTRKVEKSFELKKNPRIFINSERGMIKIHSWDKSEVKVILKLVAKNKDVDKAREELDLMSYALSETRNAVFLSNRMVLDGVGNEISSVIRAEYEIYVPHEIEINLDNEFGQVDINGTSGGVFGKLYYSDIKLVKVDVTLNLNLSIGDFESQNSELKGNVYGRHTNFNIAETGGRLRLEAEYGQLNLNYGNRKLICTLETAATDVFISNNYCYPIEMLIKGKYTPLIMDKSCYTPKSEYLQTDYNPEKKEEAWELRYAVPDKATNLIVYSKFGTLNFN